MNNIIQIAGIIDQKEAQLLVDLGVEYLGFPLKLPVNSVDHTEQQAAEIIKTIKPPHKPVIITYQNHATDIIEFLDYLRANIIQLHGDISLQELKKIKTVRPDITVFKSLVIGKYSQQELVKYINDCAQYIDAFITDSYNPSTGATGATGLTHDWSISRQLVELSPKPIILAGGLTAENVAKAIKQVKPAGVDAHTGVEDANDRKSSVKVKSFIESAKQAFAELN